MSDLQCPARIIVARHGEAKYADPELISDEGGWLTDLGKEQAAALGERLRDERVAAVYTSRLDRAQETGALVGDRLGLTPSTIEGVQEFSVGSLAGTPATGPVALEAFVAWISGDLERRWPGAETGTEVVARFVEAVGALADRHRGETVVVVSHGGVMSLAIPNTAGNTDPELAAASDIPNCAAAELAVDADGWRLVGPWPGRRWEVPDAGVGSPGAGD
ncbi:MAG: histidine phosphatase family protein [Lapillicoccus sp.]